MYIRSEADVLLQITQDVKDLQSLGIMIILDNIKGHQDDNQTFSDLSRESQLNGFADTFATNFLAEGIMTPYEAFPANPANL
jgi:hypothetical protein